MIEIPKELHNEMAEVVEAGLQTMRVRGIIHRVSPETMELCEKLLKEWREEEAKPAFVFTVDEGQKNILSDKKFWEDMRTAVGNNIFHEIVKTGYVKLVERFIEARSAFTFMSYDDFKRGLHNWIINVVLKTISGK